MLPISLDLSVFSSMPRDLKDDFSGSSMPSRHIPLSTVVSGAQRVSKWFPKVEKNTFAFPRAPPPVFWGPAAGGDVCFLWKYPGICANALFAVFWRFLTKSRRKIRTEPGNHPGNHVETRWKPPFAVPIADRFLQWFPPGFHLVSTWFPDGFHPKKGPNRPF